MDNIICIKNCSLNPCHFTTWVRGSCLRAGFAPLSPSCISPRTPSQLSLSLCFFFHSWTTFSFFLCCSQSVCDMCSCTLSPYLPASLHTRAHTHVRTLMRSHTPTRSHTRTSPLASISFSLWSLSSPRLHRVSLRGSAAL